MGGGESCGSALGEALDQRGNLTRAVLLKEVPAGERHMGLRELQDIARILKAEAALL